MEEDLTAEDWVGYCEFCGPTPTVKAVTEEEAIALSFQVHLKANTCNGGPLIVAAFRKKEVR